MFFYKLNTKDFCVQQCIFRWTVLGVNVWVGERKEAVFLTCICQVQKISMWQKSVALTAGCLQAKQPDIKIPQMKDGLNFSIRRVNRGAERKNIFLLGQG